MKTISQAFFLDLTQKLVTFHPVVVNLIKSVLFIYFLFSTSKYLPSTSPIVLHTNTKIHSEMFLGFPHDVDI